MKKILFAALGASLLAGFAVNDASAAPRHQRTTWVPAPARADDGFRNAYNAYDRSYEPRGFSGLAEGGAIAAPAGR